MRSVAAEGALTVGVDAVLQTSHFTDACDGGFPDLLQLTLAIAQQWPSGGEQADVVGGDGEVFADDLLD
jgi:hypothetical protein